MESSPENFDALQKLLKLKRYEQPPPRYFNEFSRNVIARIQAGEAQARTHWWERFGIDLRPVLSLGVGAAACVALFFSMAPGSNADGETASVLGVAAPAIVAAPAPAAQDTFTQPEAVDSVAANSTNPVYNAAGTMFSDPFRARVMPASYKLR